METVASSAVCMRGRHRHRSSGVTVGCVRPWVYQRGYRVSLPHFFPRSTILPLPHSHHVLRVSSFFRGFRLPRLPVGGRTAPPRASSPLPGWKTHVVMVTALSATPPRAHPRQHGRRRCAHPPPPDPAPVPFHRLPSPYPCQGSARGCFCTGQGAEARIPPRKPPWGHGVCRPRTLERARVPLTRLAVSTIPLRTTPRLSPVARELCKCVGILQASS